MVETVAPVSGREAEVLAALAEHLTNAEIAQRLHISVRTVESHVSSMLRKLALPDRRALAAYGADLASAGTAPQGDGGLRGGPVPVTSFIGRGAELDAVAVALREARLVNLVGPGGVGKTRLAAEAARREAAAFPAGAWFVDLVPVRAGSVATALASALGVAERPHGSLEDALVDTLRPRRALLLLDNCEHVLAPVAALVERLLLSCPDLRILTTSRELLRIDGERVVPLGELDDAEAVALFVERARALDPSFAPDADTDDGALAEICRRLDGIPLAIELASARCAVIGLDGVRDGLADRLRLLSGARRTDNRHRSLRDVLDWSHDLLEPDEQVLLRRLSAFSGDVTADDAHAVVGAGLDRAAVLDGLAQLTAKSLLVRRSGEGTTRYRLLETVRAYASEQLDASGEGHEVRRRHLEWVAATATEAEAALVAGDPWPFDGFADDARAALAWAGTHQDDAATGAALACAFAHLAYARHFLAEAEATYEQAARLTTDDLAAATALQAAAGVAYARMRGDLAFGHQLQAAELARTVGDHRSAAISLADAASLALRCPAEFRVVPPQEELEGLIAQAAELGDPDDPVVVAHLAHAEAWLAARLVPGGDLDLAHRAVTAAQAVDDMPLISGALDAETACLWARGRISEAGRHARLRLDLLPRLVRHDPRTGGEVIDMFHMAADTAIAAGLLHEALDHAELMRKDELGATVPHASTRGAVIALALLGRFSEAIAEADAMRHEWEAAGRPSAGWMAPASIAAELAHGLTGDHAAAAAWAEVTERVGEAGFLHCTKAAFKSFTGARVALHEGRIDDAVQAMVPWERDEPSDYLAYGLALAVELAVVSGAADAEQQLAAARIDIDGNPWGEACLLRAEGRLRSDRALLAASAAAFDQLDSRFEWAVTACLLGGDEAERARAALQELGATLPVAL